ncbi:MAG: FAD-binding oxidoreductase [Vicinamibacterales bacterium]
MLLTRPVLDIRVATPRARIIHIDLQGTAFPFLPGQAIWLGAHGQDLRKPYSIASSPEDAERDGRLELLVGVDAEGEPGPHLPLRAGTLVDIDGPVGSFTFPDTPSTTRFLFIAGGTGISPLRSMLRHSLQIPHEAIGLLYSARLPEEFAYADELRALADAGTIELRMTVTRDAAQGQWSGTRGRITRDDLLPLVHDQRTLCFVCGPPALVEEMPRVLQSLGVPADRVLTERWARSGT